ncbi:oxygen-dependent tRNA uridine(34) hydroxylase TrhO [Desmospora profundinema]|uniref:tRNA uridine(34) hydroxylase n=1 Tax=Desmospora profundinema TaxID=1571184 RepID=A0ABU1IML9_9BACL|nr:rhodanese-related sulfurtransferase [Desmospora profundinema]MDR6225025.1 UPF0176 protein [Desmospora profundinema]
MNHQPAYQVLLYYQFVPIENPEAFAEEHLQFCRELGLKGRILVAPEGINGTVSGTVEQTEVYMAHLKQDPRFANMAFKVDPHDGHAFKKMHVRPKEELVTFRVEGELDPNNRTGQRLNPRQFYEAMQQEDVLIVDGRNDYEYDLGHFRGAIRPDVHSFREFPEWIREHLSPYKDRTILTYCTGGIRCEKLTAFMLEEGFQHVAQLDGGIVTYGKDPEVRGRLFDGKCFVFDERLSVPVNQEEEVVVGTCIHCGKSAETPHNCADPSCHHLHLCCPDCREKQDGYCSDSCRENHGRTSHAS